MNLFQRTLCDDTDCGMLTIQVWIREQQGEKVTKFGIDIVVRMRGSHALKLSEGADMTMGGYTAAS